jgi:NAD(P) transhydrogenase
MNRSLTNVLFGGISAPTSVDAHKIEGTITKTTVDDTVEALANADSVILVRSVFRLSFTIHDTTC